MRRPNQHSGGSAPAKRSGLVARLLGGLATWAAVAALAAVVVWAFTGGSTFQVDESAEHVSQSSSGPPEEEGEERREASKQRFDQPDEAEEFFILKRSPDGRMPIPFARYRAAMERTKEMRKYSTAAGKFLGPQGIVSPWTSLGPETSAVAPGR